MPSFAKHAADPVLLLAILGLVLFGFIMVASASSVVAEQFHHDPYFFFKHQVFFGGSFGILAFTLGFFVPYYRWRIIALPGILIAIVLLLLVFVPGLQVSYGGASRWIGVGPITVQPTEIAKLAIIIYLAALLGRKGEEVQDFRVGVIPFLVITGVMSGLIILQPDIGTLFIITAIAGTMVFVAGFRLRHVLLFIFGGFTLFVILLNTAHYRLARIVVYLHPELDPQGIGYQINQALLAVSTGGLWGLGFGRSRQKYFFLPEPAGDSIFAILAEELGFLRTLAVIGVFVLISFRGFVIARKAPDLLGKLLATGITVWVVLQVFVNMGSILGITPLTGVPLPYVSYGGSALVTLLFASGILLNVSKYTQDNSRS